MKKIGLTGNIGSGKTLVAEIFSTLGVPVFHADQEARELYRLPEVKQRIIEIVGEDVFLESGELNKKKMAAIVFSDTGKLEKVNRLIHPLVRERFQTYAGNFQAAPYIIYEAAILVESGHYQQMDGIIVVYAPAAVRIERVKDRDSVTEDEVLARMKNQASDEDKMRVADWIVYNDGSRPVIPQVLEIDSQLRRSPGK